MTEIKLNVDFGELFDDYGTRDQIRTQLREQVKKVIDAELKDTLIELFRKQDLLDTDTVRNIIKDTIIKHFSEIVAKDAHKFLDKIVNTQTDFLGAFHNYMQKYNEKFLSIMAQSGDLENVRFSFMTLNSSDERIEKAVRQELLKRDDYNIVALFDSYAPNYFKDNPKAKQIVSDMLAEKRNGRPDLVCMQGSNLVFIEVKSPEDGLKRDQVLWAKNHPFFPVIYLYVDLVDVSEGQQ